MPSKKDRWLAKAMVHSLDVLKKMNNDAVEKEALKVSAMNERLKKIEAQQEETQETLAQIQVTLNEIERCSTKLVKVVDRITQTGRLS